MRYLFVIFLFIPISAFAQDPCSNYARRQTLNINYTAATGTTSLVSPRVDESIYICGYVIASAGDGTIIFQEGQSDCSTNLTDLETMTFDTNIGYAYGFSVTGNAHFRTRDNYGLCITRTASVGLVGRITYVYR